ncbi:MBL fold metallo-hydrolase [Nocardioides sp. AE5]|uniref:MBL fold metallo-hydrolase n=1 Tax=Nocardioides sp. AE5 TaxID=2962573 RepID=UPI002882B71D|nr:MBL fold metallo-hydrolase [Nocardioides sp. AE5]MDT0200913.1 MBL fold metallo-hydrolase [Nocardioides sp. AE5]
MKQRAWDEPGAEQVLDGVFRIPLPLPDDGLRAVNVYAISEGSSVTMIDAGWALAESLAALERGLAEAGHSLSDIEQFLVTHSHGDHYAQAATVRRMFGSEVSIGAGERGSIEAMADPAFEPFSRIEQSLKRAGAEELLSDMLAWRRGARDKGPHVPWELPDRWLSAGTISLKSRDLEVVDTPGHTAGHVVFHDLVAGVLFAGDHVLPRITPSIGFEPGGADLPLADFLDSQRVVLERPDARLLPAHGPVTDSTHARAEELIAHHEKRLDETAAAVDSGASTTYEVAQHLGWTRHERRLAELDMFNQNLAIGETRAHLDVCVVRGWLDASEGTDGIVRYTRA